eukprot:9484323-Pyramimonas_sp.AAC.1
MLRLTGAVRCLIHRTGRRHAGGGAQENPALVHAQRGESRADLPAWQAPAGIHIVGLLHFTGLPVPVMARMHTTPQRPMQVSVSIVQPGRHMKRQKLDDLRPSRPADAFAFKRQKNIPETLKALAVQTDLNQSGNQGMHSTHPRAV